MRTRRIKGVGLLIALFIVQVGYGQMNVKQFVSKFSERTRVERVNLGGFAMKLGRLFSETYGVSHVDVFSLSECSESDKQQFHEAMSSLKDNNYETMVSTKDKGEHTKILVKMKKDYIEELLVLTSGDSPAIVRLKGKIKPSDIEKLSMR